MTKVTSAICVLFIGGLALVCSGVSPNAALPGVEASSSEIGTSHFEVRSELGTAQARWLRLRWIFAGVSLSAILLVSLRQLRVLVRPTASRALLPDMAEEDAAAPTASSGKRWPEPQFIPGNAD